jgi:hypothetical protein
MPAWLYHLNVWDLMGIFAYTQTLALLESVIILLFVTLLAAALPAKLLKDRFVAQGSMMVLVTSAFAIVAQSTTNIPFANVHCTSKRFILGVTLYLVSIAASFVLIRRYKRIERLIVALIDRFMLLMGFYMIISVCSTIIIIIRNIGKVT